MFIIILVSFQIAALLNKVLLAISHSFNLIIYCLSSKSFRKLVFSKFSRTNFVSRTSEPQAERLTVFGDEMRRFRDMLLSIQHSMEHVDTRYRKRAYTCHNRTMHQSEQDGLSHPISLQYLDLAIYRRNPMDEGIIAVPENNPIVSNLSKSCVILNHIAL